MQIQIQVTNTFFYNFAAARIKKLKRPASDNAVYSAQNNFAYLEQESLKVSTLGCKSVGTLQKGIHSHKGGRTLAYKCNTNESSRIKEPQGV